MKYTDVYRMIKTARGKDPSDIDADIRDLVNVIVWNAPERWKKLGAKYEQYNPSDYGIDSYAVVGKDKVPVDFDEKEIDSLRKIFKIIQKKSGRPWKASKFQLNNKGDYEIRFRY